MQPNQVLQTDQIIIANLFIYSTQGVQLLPPIDKTLGIINPESQKFLALFFEKFNEFGPSKEDVERNTLSLFEFIVKVLQYFKVSGF